MNKRFCKLGRNWLKALCVLSVCGATYSCSDDYKLDDSNPTWLGSSIYEYLQSQGNYKNFVNLIDDLDYAEVLGKTGSKTLFVADDEAFDEFYRSNIWGVKSYSELTTAQKKLLLNSAMVNNAYLLEMMSSTVGPVKGECLRRETAADVTDSVPHFTADELPVSYNESGLETDYWARFRQPGKGGIYMAIDNTSPMMTHFLPAQMSNKNITDEDFRIIVGQTRDDNDAFIFDCKVIEQDITCQNGYINKLDKVLLTPQNMAEVLRTSGKTNIFSHMIERFSAPFYSSDLTNRYRLLYGNDVDSVFQKRYFSARSQGGSALDTDQNTDPVSNPSGNTVTHALQFDPGWNTYASGSGAKETDMGVIFAPSDSRLYDYFFAADGGGRFLIEAYAPQYLSSVNGSADYTNIYKCIDQIPLDVIQALINNLMKDSFCNSVPSKFETIKDDAQDPMLDETHLDKIQDVFLANNGVIFLMDEVLTPAKYAAVSAPAYVGTDMHIFNWAVNQSSLDVQTNFYAYLLAMSSRFSFFVPQDEGFWYIDPVSFAKGTGEQRALYYEWDSSKSQPKCSAYRYNYDFTTGEGSIGEPLTSVVVTSTEYMNRLRDMLETHTIVHEDNTETTGIDETATGIECDQHYFLAKNGAPIYVENAEKRDQGCMIQGGWQNVRDEWRVVNRFDDKTRETNGNGNGMAYKIDAPIQPTIESVFSTLYNNREDFGLFYELCQTDEEVLEAIGIKGSTNLRPYIIFENGNGLPCYDKQTGDQVATATNVRLFNNYRYTVYVPTNAAVEDAISKGLPTWEDLRKILELDKEPEERTELTTEQEQKRNEKCLAMVTMLINFIKYHFQDNSVFADTPALKPTDYETATLNSETGVYCKLNVSSTGNGTLTVRDAAGNSHNIVAKHNILTRDYILNSGKTTIDASSFAVVHGIDGVLNYETLPGGRYDSAWATSAAAKKYLAKYRIIE
ncbi:MAG: fasciclin domain-containing protein [Bacteroides sp.]|nr:fasciclin domain-containing protein [Roseburia sp.]MCM1346206.1 fasciclin domain-containing protein [Bacteroides sp.]MCM1419967.1 fasciclin domain-containing protein [Bacteroides sp.]